jgi:hypothetical protein
MNVSDSWKQFKKLWNNKLGQLELPFLEMDIIEPKQHFSKKKELSDYNKKLKKALDYKTQK